MCKQGFWLSLALVVTGSLMVNPVTASGFFVAQADSSTSDAPQKARLIDLWQPGDPGQRMNIRGRVTSIDGTPLAGVTIALRQANGEGDYTDRYSATLVSDAKGRYQFGSVVPANYSGARHVHVSVFQDGFKYYSTSILFKDDPNLEYHYEYGKAIFLEESTVNGETILFGRFDILLTPQ